MRRYGWWCWHWLWRPSPRSATTARRWCSPSPARVAPVRPAAVRSNATTIRFNQAMVPLGDPRAKAPFKTGCAGTGRWVDPQTWVFDFAAPLTGDAKCSFDAVEGLKSVSGYSFSGRANYTVEAGGPRALAVLPSGDEIEEDQVFLVAAPVAPTRASVAANAYCAVDGLGEKIPVDVLDAGLPAKLLGEMGTRNWSVRSFLENAGLPEAVPATPAERLGRLCGDHRAEMPPRAAAGARHGAGVGQGDRFGVGQARGHGPAVRLHRA
ncbi:hypothetical protein MOP88_06150 [Sphingomonas sp. WKB10]|nr:hypothetical protein [Sphingomonas sp. WKB10]